MNRTNGDQLREIHKDYYEFCFSEEAERLATTIRDDARLEKLYNMLRKNVPQSVFGLVILGYVLGRAGRV